MRIDEIQNEIVEEFSLFEDWMQKYEYIIELGKTIKPIDNKNKVDSNLIKGCQSKLWLHAELKNGKVIYIADRHAIITKGIAAVLLRVFSNQIHAQLLKYDVVYLDIIGLKEHL